MRLECLAGSGNSVGQDCIESCRCGESGLNEWGKPKRHCGDVAAWHGDTLRVYECFALLRAVSGEQLGQTIGPGALVLGAVELLPSSGTDEAVVGGEVDDERLGTRLFELGGNRSGLTVRESQDDDIVAGEHLGGGLLDHEIGISGKMGLMSAERLTHGGMSAHRGDVEMRVSAQQPEDLSPAYPVAPETATVRSFICITIPAH